MGPEVDVQNGWNLITGQSIVSTFALTLLYYEYALTFDLERRLFWSQRSFKQLGSVLFFLNRYCAIIGYAPLVIQKFVLPESPLYLLCNPVHPYRKVLAFLTQTIIGIIFIARTYALYDRSRVVLIGLISLAVSVIAVSIYMISQDRSHFLRLIPLNGPIGCLAGSPRSQSWRLAVIWGGVMVFHLVVVVLTLVKTIQIKRRSGKDHTLTHLLIRDGVVYFGIINLVMLSNILTLLYGSEVMRGIPNAMINIVASVLVSRLMFNLREQREHPETTEKTTAATSVPASTILSHMLTNIEEVDEDVVHESLNQQGAEIDSITERRVVSGV